MLLPAEDKPSLLFRKLFLQGDAGEVARRLRRLEERASILDAVREDMKGLQKGLGASDRERLDQYFTSVRELEERLHLAGEWERRPKPATEAAEPADIADPGKFFQKFELMLAMARLALESDATRIVTLMVDGFATPVFEISDSEKSLNGYHNLSHHGQAKEKIAQLERVDRRQMEVLSGLIGALAEKREGDARLLDRPWSSTAATSATRTCTTRRTCPCSSRAAVSNTGGTSPSTASATRRSAACMCPCSSG